MASGSIWRCPLEGARDGPIAKSLQSWKWLSIAYDIQNNIEGMDVPRDSHLHEEEDKETDVIQIVLSNTRLRSVGNHDCLEGQSHTGKSS